jgi:hypothetical protein
MTETTARADRLLRRQESFARQVVELLLPACLAASPYGPVVAALIPESVSDSLIVLTLLFATLLTVSFSKLPTGVVFLALSGVIIVALTQRPNLLAVTLIPLIVFSLRQVDIRKVVRVFLVFSAILFGTVVMAYLVLGFNAGNDLHVWRDYSSSFADRSSFGFTHPNRAMPAWAVIAIGMVAFASQRGRLRLLIPIGAVTAYLYLGTDSRASTLIIAGVLSAAILWWKELDRPVGAVFRGAAVAAPVALTVISFSMSLLSTDSTLNTLLSGRPVIYANLLDQYSVFAPFGTHAVEGDIVDSGYIQLVLAKGLILAAIYLLTLTITIARSRPSRRSVLVLGAFLSLSLAETALLDLALLFLVLASLEMDRRRSMATAISEHHASRVRPFM